MDSHEEKLARETAFFMEAIEKKTDAIPGSNERRLREDEITITVYANQDNQKGGTRHREWTATFFGEHAEQFIKKPTLRELLQYLDYPEHVIDQIEYGYEAEIYAVG